MKFLFFFLILYPTLPYNIIFFIWLRISHTKSVRLEMISSPLYKQNTENTKKKP